MNITDRAEFVALSLPKDMTIRLPLDEGDRGYLVLPARPLSRSEADRVKGLVETLVVTDG